MLKVVKIMIFKEFVNKHKNDNVCPLFPMVNNFNEDWYTRLSDTVTFPQISNMFMSKFSNLHMVVGYYYEGIYEDYYGRYASFLNSINEPMKHLLKLVDITYNPYENVERHGDITTTTSGNDTTTNNFGEAINTIKYGEGTTTQNNGQRVSSDKTKTASYEGVNVDNSEVNSQINASTDTITNSEKTDTTTLGSHNDSETITYGKIEKVIDNTHGNIGVTSSMELGQQELQYAPLLNLAKLFLSLYRDEFGGILYED